MDLVGFADWLVAQSIERPEDEELVKYISVLTHFVRERVVYIEKRLIEQFVDFHPDGT